MTDNTANLQHYASPYYDPVKAHEYYMQNRELKERRSVRKLSDEGKKVWSYTRNEIKAEKKTKVEAEQEIKKQRTDEFRSNAKAMRERISSRLKDLNEALSQRASSKKKAIDERKKSDLDEITAETEKKKQRVEAKKESEIEKLMSVPIPEGLSKAEKSKRIAERNEKIAKLRSDAKSEKDKLSDRSNSDKGEIGRASCRERVLDRV